jgi:glycosyltransferase involved in cell wall biosynthesis/GT2 family glycosyltransferase
VLRVSHSAVVDAWRERERAVARRGVEVRLLSAAAWDEGGSRVPLVPRPGEPVEGVGTLGSHPALFLYDPRPLWRALGEEWDVLDLHEEPFALATAEVLLLRALRGRRMPYLVYSAQNLDKRLPPPFRWLQRRVLDGASAVSVCSTAAGEIVRRRGFPGRPDVVPLGVRPASTAPREPAARGRTIGYAGRLADHKGVDVLLEAVAGLPHTELVVAGAGPAEPGLRDRASRSDLAGRVEFLGAVQDEALAAFYEGLDVLAVPSRTTAGWVEQFGRVAVEAMAHGVPVVASDSGALPDVVGGAGLLVAPDDAIALRDALARMLDDAALRARAREVGLRIAADCRWDVVADRYLDIYRRVSRSDGTPVPRDRGVEVVVVAYGTPERLRLALAPLDGLPVTVVDNSASPQVRRVCSDLGVRYLDAGGNRGFGGGVNLALDDRLDPTADVLLVNPDAVVGADDVAALHRALLADPALASVGPAQVDESGTPTRVAWPFPSPSRTWTEAVGLGRVLGDRADFAIGSVLLLRSEALAQVGGFDEDFFLYAEETDWAYRAARLGWHHAVVPSVTAMHTGGASSTDAARRQAHFHASQERYLRKHFGAAGWQVARAGQLAGSAARSVLPGGRGTAARDRIRRYLRGPVAVERAYRNVPEVAA